MISTVPTVPYIFEYSDGRYVTHSVLSLLDLAFSTSITTDGSIPF